MTALQVLAAVVTFAVSPRGQALAVAVAATVHSINVLWKSKDSRAAKIAKIAYGAWYAAEGAGARNKWDGVEKSILYRQLAERAAARLGVTLTPKDWGALRELAEEYSHHDHADAAKSASSPSSGPSSGTVEVIEPEPGVRP